MYNFTFLLTFSNLLTLFLTFLAFLNFIFNVFTSMCL